MGQGDYGPDGPGLPGRPRPHYTYSRKSNLKKNKGPQAGLDFSDNEDDDSNLQAVSFYSFNVSNRTFETFYEMVSVCCLMLVVFEES